MKPATKQIKAIDSIISIIETWKNTNDINSPTHGVDIREFLYSDLYEVCSDAEREELENCLDDLLNVIRKLNKL